MSTNLAFRYASVETFFKMIENQELWFTDLRNMNDPEEYSAGYEIVKRIINEEFPDCIRLLEEVSPNKIDENCKILICCFCSDGDRSNMWSEYGDNGKGVAIGYDENIITQCHIFTRFEEHFQPISGRVVFHPVIYSEELFREYVRKKLLAYINRSNLAIEFRHNLLHAHLIRLCSLYKRENFKSENEVRGLIEVNKHAYPPYSIEKRNTNFGIAYYHKVKFTYNNITAIREIVLGPLFEQSDEQFRSKLDDLGLKDIKIRRSICTYNDAVNL
ncbi:DUF2971 domain-containing protein [Escherichia coli]|nr:DUF2971 domain-containing protein [Escherichia coli]